MLTAKERDAFNELRVSTKTLQDLRVLQRYTGDDGKIHPSWKEAITGRWYTGEPPIQTLSAAVREFIVPEDGHAFVTIDWHQHELRILAELTQDPKLKAIFKPGMDPHVAVYERVTGNKISDNPTRRKQQRDIGKMLNYALVYGIGPEGLAGRLNVTTDQAKDLIAKHFEAFPTMAKWIRTTAETGIKNGYITTIAGRRIPIDTSLGTDEGGRAWREAVNYTLQGSSSDHLTDVLNRISTSDNGKYFEFLRAQMHDALLLDVPIGQRQALLKWFTSQMEQPFKGIAAPTDSQGPSANWKQAMDGVELDLPDLTEAE